jgi:hypothetical protein
MSTSSPEDSSLREHDSPDPEPEIWISCNPDTGYYSFTFEFRDNRPLYEMRGFESLGRAMVWADPWNERLWENPGDPERRRLLISRRKKPGAAGKLRESATA